MIGERLQRTNRQRIIQALVTFESTFDARYRQAVMDARNGQRMARWLREDGPLQRRSEVHGQP